MVDAARLADELRAEQDHAQTQEKLRKALEQQIKELQVSKPSTLSLHLNLYRPIVIMGVSSQLKSVHGIRNIVAVAGETYSTL